MAGTGGTVTVRYGRINGCAVTITGPGTFTEVGVGAASFPVTVTSSADFNTTKDGEYVVSVKVLGREVLSKTLRLQGDNGVILDAEPSLEELVDLLMPRTLTTTQIEDADHDVNTTGKYVGKMIFNSTTGLALWADGAGTTGTWSAGDGAVDHTPS